MIVLVFAASASETLASEEILNVRHWAAPDHTRIVIDLSGEPCYEVQESEKILILNFQDCIAKASLPYEIAINKPGIKKIIIHPSLDGFKKVEFILDKYQRTQVFKLKKFQDNPDRVVVDIFLEEPLRKEMVKEQPFKVKLKKVIVIDPGHGGDDPGAIGRKGSYEKNIVLSISRDIQRAINKNPGYQAVLTRDGDYYVSFNKRLQTAKDLNASLFISVHADAARNRQARGSSVYCLSTGAASSEAARLLAKNENLSDIIGGVSNGEGKTDSDQIILNMYQTNTINLSKTYAGNLMMRLDRLNGLKYKTVQEAPFRVLKLPDIPAVLIETAYISNSEEERLLKSFFFQKKLASAVSASVIEYLSATASTDRLSDKMGKNENIATRNEEKKPENMEKSRNKVYIVKKGDTLFSLARNNSVTIDELRKMNNIKDSDPLLLGQKIRLP